MLGQRRFAEISIAIQVDGLHLGSALLQKGRQPDVSP